MRELKDKTPEIEVMVDGLNLREWRRLNRISVPVDRIIEFTYSETERK